MSRWLRVARILAACLIVWLGSAAASVEGAGQPVSDMVRELAADQGFTDEDAARVTVALLETMAGPIQNGQKLWTKIEESTPERVRAYAAYTSDLVSTGYRAEFARGDVSRGMRWAHFVSLEHVPSE